MANDVARLDMPCEISGTEEDFSDPIFALTCFEGTVDCYSN